MKMGLLFKPLNIKTKIQVTFKLNDSLMKKQMEKMTNSDGVIEIHMN